MFVPLGPAIRLPVMVNGVAPVPRVLLGAPDEVPLPACTRMPAPDGKFAIVLLLIVAPLMVPGAEAVPRAPMRMALPSEFAPDVLLVRVLLLMSSEEIVPPNCWMSTPWYRELVNAFLVIDTVPLRFVSFAL